MQLIPYLANPYLADKVVQIIRQDFDINISWLAYSFPVTKIGILEDLTYPRVYANDGSDAHYNIRPEEDAVSYCFFEVNDPIIINDEEEDADYNLSVVVWGRLDKIDSGKHYDYTSELIVDMLRRLKSLNARSLEIETNPENVFDKYSGLEQAQTQNFMQPNTGFKISFIIKGDICTEPFTDSGIESCPPEHIESCD